jgi:hypothetical protein
MGWVVHYTGVKSIMASFLSCFQQPGPEKEASLSWPSPGVFLRISIKAYNELGLCKHVSFRTMPLSDMSVVFVNTLEFFVSNHLSERLVLGIEKEHLPLA